MILVPDFVPKSGASNSTKMYPLHRSEMNKLISLLLQVTFATFKCLINYAMGVQKLYLTRILAVNFFDDINPAQSRVYRAT